ncbi:ATP-binding cassette domain-containing protein [Kitasatospora sp. MAP5-34]|uniref:ABC transporter ATP-binding protein n=1 Tax=Kitasatospora sp. MAP5-34 TaxID=3035102 RepID=UPI002474D3A3|nr:ATP-binding cassette domain-containing protein [Kitasatospora sp. MAP5-34]MDH6577270.1 peptide/nickel transport system ATP-binding protein [Kitasatospora sp. MAP5-34]
MTTVRVTARVTDLSIAISDGPQLLTGATLTLTPGRVHALTGPSGAGKTTLLRALLGALPPGARRTAGTVTVLGHDPLDLPERELRALRRHRLAYVGQDPGSGLNPRMRVGRLITETAADPSGQGLRDLLAQVRLPTDEQFERRRPGELSGGQQRRVALARALARRPELLLLDEPTAGLDPALRDEIADLLRELATRHGLAVALATHDPRLVSRCADDVLTLTLTPATRRTPARAPRTRTAPASPAPALVTARGLGAYVGGRRDRRPVLTDLDLDLTPGTRTGIVGASGSGKTTLVRLLAGLHPPATGTLALAGTPLAPSHRARTREQRRRIQLVPQNPLGALNPARTIGATLTRPLRLHFSLPQEQCAARVAGLLRSVGLPSEFADRYPYELSGGQRQRVSIARALAAEPDVLLCDEVTSALDADTATGIMGLLSGLCADHGLALALVSHDLPLVGTYADTVLTLGGAAPAPVELSQGRVGPG